MVRAYRGRLGCDVVCGALTGYGLDDEPDAQERKVF